MTFHFSQLMLDNSRIGITNNRMQVVRNQVEEEVQGTILVNFLKWETRKLEALCGRCPRKEFLTACPQRCKLTASFHCLSERTTSFLNQSKLCLLSYNVYFDCNQGINLFSSFSQSSLSQSFSHNLHLQQFVGSANPQKPFCR